MASAHARKSVKGSGNVGMLTGRRNRQETMLSIRKAKEDAYATRRNLKANATVKDAASRTELLQNLALRSQALLVGTFPEGENPANPRQMSWLTDIALFGCCLTIGIQHKDAMTRRKSMRAFVYLLSSGVPPLFDESDSQHLGLWNTILAALPSFVAILNEDIQDSNSVQMHSDAAFALRFISSMDKARIVVESGTVPKLVQLFQSGISEVQIQAAWCLGNIASESAACCEEILKICPPSVVLPHIRMSTPALRRAAVWLLRSLVEFPEAMAKCEALGPETKRDILETLTNIILQLSNEKVQTYVAANGQTESGIVFKQAAPIAPWRIFEVPLIH